MRSQRLVTTIVAAAMTTALGAPHGVRVASAGQNTPPLSLGTSASLDGLLSATLLFFSADTDKDGVVTRDELTSAGRRWLTSGAAADGEAVTREQLTAALDAAMPRSGLSTVFNMGGGGAQPQTPHPVHVQAMLTALPDQAPARPLRPRKVLVLARAAGFVHSSIPLAATTMDALGQKTGAWTTTISYDAADITADNLTQYDAVFLASTTGAFLDDPDNASVTAARRQALLDFVRGGKGLAGIHAATDAYHEDKALTAPGSGVAGTLRSFSAGATIAPVMMRQGDRNGDQRLDRAEVDALTNAWFETLDRAGTGRLTQPDFAFFALTIPQPTGANAPRAPQGPDTHVGTWPDFNRMIGGYFKYHWLDPQKISVKIDDPTSPLTVMFKDESLDVHDEIYTMSSNSWSRDNVRVLTSIDYGRMSDADRTLEEHPRADRDYGLSWVRREGQGRVFYQALGHSERIYAMTPLLEHLLAGMQYALGDLKADDTPRAR